MNIEEIRTYCLKKAGVSESFPFNDTALVFKVADKMFALLDLSQEGRGISLKCNPELAVELREKYTEVMPGYHFNKKHWNTVDIQGALADQLITDWIDHSYQIVVDKLPKNQRDKLEKLV